MIPIVPSRIVLVCCLLCLANITAAQSLIEESSPEEVVRSLYQLISFEKDTSPNWDQVRPLFHDQASVYLRTSLEEMTLYNPDGFIARFKSDIYEHGLSDTGFAETILGLGCDIFGDISQCRVVYQAARLTGETRPLRGVDSFQLLRQAGAWKIFSILSSANNASSGLRSFRASGSTRKSSWGVENWIKHTRSW